MTVWVIGAIGIILVLAAITCLIFAFGLDRRLAAMQATRTLSAAEVLHLHQAGARGTRCEVVGVIECDSPLSSPLSNTICVAYKHEVTRHVEKGVYSSFEQRSRYQREYTEVDPPDERRVRFYVRDTSGRILIDPTWAMIDMPRTKEQYDAFTSGVGMRNVANTGSWHTEDTLAIGSQAYVLGYISETYGEPSLACHPQDRAEPYVISYRNERQIARGAGARSSVLFLIAGFAGVFGVLLIVMAAKMLI